MNVWIPWDADETEINALRIIREPLPKELGAPLLAWLRARLTSGYSQTDPSLVHELQSALRITIAHDPAYIETEAILQELVKKGDSVFLRVVDYLLARSTPRTGNMSMPSHIRDLSWHLDHTGSGLKIVTSEGIYRLATRLPEGVEEAAQVSAEAASSLAGTHLANAWAATRLVNADSSKAMSEAMKAAEVAAGAIVTPKDQRLRMSKVVSRLKAREDWGLILDQRDDGEPDHRAMIIGMLETLSFAQSDRHGGQPHSPEEAQAYVLLSSLVVGWFSTGAVAFPIESAN